MSGTAFFITKVAVSALLIALVSEVAKQSDRFGGLIAALPVTTFLIIVWMAAEGASDEKIAAHMKFTLYFVLPTLPMFLLFPLLIKHLGFIGALAASIALTAALVYLFNIMYERFGIDIL